MGWISPILTRHPDWRSLVSPPVEVPDAAVRTLLRRWFPGQGVVSKRMGSGGSTPVYRVILGATVTYLRLAEEPGERRDAEVRVHELLLTRELPVPEVLRFEPAPPELDRSATLTSAIAGRPIDGQMPIAAVRRIARQAGRDLAVINSLPVEGYGWVDEAHGEDRHLVAEHRTRAAWASEYLAAMDTVIASRVLDPGLDGTLHEAMRAWSDLPDRGWSSLAHGDFDTTHIHADPETHTYAGIIDLGEIRGADPLYDLGHLWTHTANAFETDVFDHVLAGYRERTDIPDDWHVQIRLQAIAIATRALAIQLGRPESAYRWALITRLGTLLDEVALSP